MNIHRWAKLLSATLLLAVSSSLAAQEIPHPRDVLGFEPGADYHLADHSQLVEYYRTLDAATDRLRLIEIGRSTQGRPMVLMFISSEENLAQLDRWREISRRLALARDLTDEQARELAREGRAVIWIDSGLHSSEVAHAQHAPLLAYHMVTDESDETRRIRDDVILILMPVMNPDGQDIVVNWYREQLGTEWETTGTPILYHEYVGHDINRDWYMILQQETRNLAQVLYHEWHPQVLMNHHQAAPFPARIHIPPFWDPLNPHSDPRIVRGTNLFGTYMARRFEVEGKTGVLSRRNFEMWRADGTRYAPYYRNMIGLHTEVGHPSATPRYHDPDSLPEMFSGLPPLSAREPSVFYANPWPGGWARLGDAVDYHMTASLGVLDLASRLREEWLYGRYEVGRDQIRAGEQGGPFAFVIPPDQWDPGAAVKLINALRRGGAEVHRASGAFTANGRSYPAGTYVVSAAQAFRPLVRVLLEPQTYPDRRLYPGGPIDPPRDLTGWLMPAHMGVRVDQVDEPFQASLDVVDEARVEPGRVVGSGSWGYVFSRERNAGAVAVNRLLAAGASVSWTSGAVEAQGRSFATGSVIVRSGTGASRERIGELARELGLDFYALDQAPGVGRQPLRPYRVGLYRSWMANIDEGWTRWLLEQHEFPLESLSDQDIRGGDLSRFSAILIPAQGSNAILNGHAPGRMPPEFVGGLGAEGTAALERFVRDGGTLIGWEGATDYLMEQLELPVRPSETGVWEDEFFIPGSIVRIEADPAHPVSYGMPTQVGAFFMERQGSRSRAFDLPASGSSAAGVDVAVRYASRDLAMSGLVVGEEYIAGKPAVVRVGHGSGQVVLFGFRPQFRAQPSGTYKMLFNAIQGSAVEGLPRPGALTSGSDEP
jgi:hypothetical protein